MRAAVGIIACVITAPLSAQWLNYPTPGMPRLPDGKANLTAPPPRAADGKPDLSGIWGLACPVGNNAYGTLYGQPNVYCATEVAIPPEFTNIGQSLKDGLPYQPWAAELVKKTRAANRPNDPMTRCFPPGIIRLDVFPLFRKVVQVSGLLVILNEQNASYRQIFTDGRPQPEDPNPAWNGYSSGKWEGDTLVVQTTGFRDGLWLDTGASPLTDAARVTEKFRRVNYGTLEIELTVDDRKAYTKPWTILVKQILAPDTELMDYICLENEKDVRHLPGN
ncbi:MAG TPA: hypothetical protein VLZ81_03630 [Blastocatellia bacterium]|nr:hypothetical protein [Blastocatellia bacterium]